MTKKAVRTALALTLATWLLIFPGGVPAAAAEGSFKDTARHWSGQAVEKSYALGLMKGYPGDVFKPEDPVSRLEAIATIIRAMGLEDEAKNLDWRNSGIKLPAGMTWGQGHLVVAAQKGLIHRDYTQQLLYNNPIARYEVAILMSLALRDKLRVVGDVQKLSFTDTQEILPDYRQYVADVTQNNIMQGLENNRFGPNEVLKRGQMAALLVKAVQDGWFQYGAANIVTGPLAAIDSSAGVLKISGDTLRPVDPGAVFYRDSKQVSMDDFRVGDAVTAITWTGGKVKYLEAAAGTGIPATPPADTQYLEVTGKIVDRALTGNLALKIRDSGQRDHLYPLDTVVSITEGTSSRDLSYLVDGQYVTVRVKNNVIQFIKMLPSENIEGEVTSILPGYFTIKTHAGTNRIFMVKSADLRITKGSLQLPFTDLKTGHQVRVFSVSGEAREINLLESITTKTQIRTVDPFYRIISVLDDTGARREYEVEVRALIKQGDEYLRIEDLKRGDEVTLKVGTNGKITEILLEDPNLPTVSGKVTDIWYGNYPRIYIDHIKYEIAGYAIATRDGRDISLKDIIVGSIVKVKLQFKENRDIVTGIEVLDDRNITVEGTVTGVDADLDKITVEQQSRLEFTFPVERDCIFVDQTLSTSNVRYLEDVQKGWNTKLYLRGGKVTEIRVTSR